MSVRVESEKLSSLASSRYTQTQDHRKISTSSSRLFSMLSQIDQALEKSERFLLILGVWLMAGVSIANVIGRNLNFSLAFAEEAAQILMVLITFIGLGYGVRHARHIRVSAIHDLLPHQARKYLLVFVSLISSALLFALAYFALQYLLNIADSGRVTPALRLPLTWVYALVPLGFVLGGIQYLLAGIRNLISADNYLAWDVKDEYTTP